MLKKLLNASFLIVNKYCNVTQMRTRAACGHTKEFVKSLTKLLQLKY